MHADTPSSRRWLRLAVVYFAAGVSLGVGMGASGDHSLFPLHAHINLLGWVSMALFGLIAGARPRLLQGRLATLQFWLYNLSLPTMLVSLAARLKGYSQVEPVLGLASVCLGLSVLLFAGLVLAGLQRERPLPPAASP